MNFALRWVLFRWKFSYHNVNLFNSSYQLVIYHINHTEHVKKEKFDSTAGTTVKTGEFWPTLLYNVAWGKQVFVYAQLSTSFQSGGGPDFDWVIATAWFCFFIAILIKICCLASATYLHLNSNFHAMSGITKGPFVFYPHSVLCIGLLLLSTVICMQTSSRIIFQ